MSSTEKRDTAPMQVDRDTHAIVAALAERFGITHREVIDMAVWTFARSKKLTVKLTLEPEVSND